MTDRGNTVLHIVPHTHWDREWYLTFQQFRLKLVHLIDGLLDLLAADPDYACFTLDGQTIVLNDYLAMRPERRAEIAAHVRSGRLLIGPFHILPDEFLVSPEATVRNLLEGDRTARQFGGKMRVGYLPDTFGHIGQMPQILAGFGMAYACLTRGLADEPCELWWEAPDGSRVLLSYQRETYGNAAGLQAGEPALFVAGLEDAAGLLAPHSASGRLLLNYGMDHMEPHPGLAAAIAAARERLPQYEILHSNLPAYFAGLADDLAREGLPGAVRGELRQCKRHPLLPGVLSARVWIKQRNRACEALLEKWAEPFAVWAEWAAAGRAAAGRAAAGRAAAGRAAAGQRPPELLRSPAALLRPAWRLLMACHPHDSICGCSIDQVHDEMRPRFDQAEQIGEELTGQALATIAAAIDTRLPGSDAPVTPVVVFNPSSFERSDLVRLDLEAPEGCGGFELVDEAGRALAFQTSGLGSRQLINMRLERKEFRATAGTVSEGNIAGMGLQDIRVTRAGAEARIDIVLSEQGAANHAAWTRGMDAITKLLDDPTVTTYVVGARSASVSRVAFVAPAVPPCGYRTFWAKWQPVTPAEPARVNPLLARLAPLAVRLADAPLVKRGLAAAGRRRTGRTPPRIENEFCVALLDDRGLLTVEDKRTGARYAGLNRFTDGGDRGDEYNYCPPEEDRVVAARLRSVEVTRGAVVQTIEATLELDAPRGLTSDRRGRCRDTVRLPVRTRIALAAGMPRIDIHTEIDNRAEDHRLRVHFPTGISTDTAEFDGHYEVVRRALGLPAYDASWVEQPRPEAPQRAFTAVANERYGLLVANRGLHEAAVLPHAGGVEIVLTLLRCVGYLSRDDLSTRKGGHAGPAIATPGAQMPGRWGFDYALAPFAVAERLTAIRQAYGFEVPLRAIQAALQPGSLPGRLAFLQVAPPEFVISAVKAAEDGRGFIVRGYNVDRDPVDVQMAMWRPFARVERVSLAEERLPAQNLTVTGERVALPVGGHEIVTLRFADAD